MNILIVVDMQNDFIDGSLGTKEALGIVESAKEKIKNFKGKIIYTRDTHSENYLQTKEGEKLPVEHCIIGTKGWEIREELYDKDSTIIDKPTFGSLELIQEILNMGDDFNPNTDSIELIGLCTDICVVSNALLLKAHFYNTDIAVDSSCCAGVTPESHGQALEVMKMCQIAIK